MASHVSAVLGEGGGSPDARVSAGDKRPLVL